jgi:hypothetical protein
VSLLALQPYINFSVFLYKCINNHGLKDNVEQKEHNSPIDGEVQDNGDKDNGHKKIMI